MANKVYDIITDRIMEQLNKGVIPWKKPWSAGGMPRNGISQNEYNGINPMLLSCTGFYNPNWFSFNQARQAGGSVKHDQKGTPIIFWKKSQYATPDGEQAPQEGEKKKSNSYLILRYYTVFNYEQCENMPEKYAVKHQEPKNSESCINATRIMKEYAEREKMPILHHEQRAYYSPALDIVNMPAYDSFKDAISYYKTGFHELIHSTGHEKRLNRLDKHACFGNEVYSKEELTAEMGASFLSGHAEIYTEDQHQESASYIASWLRVLHDDKTMVIKAAAAAQRASDYILKKEVN